MCCLAEEKQLKRRVKHTQNTKTRTHKLYEYARLMQLKKETLRQFPVPSFEYTHTRVRNARAHLNTHGTQIAMQPALIFCI